MVSQRTVSPPGPSPQLQVRALPLEPAYELCYNFTMSTIESKSPTVQMLVEVANQSQDSVLIHCNENDTIDGMSLIFANKQSAEGGSHNFPELIGKTLVEIYGKSMVNEGFAKTFLKVAQDHQEVNYQVEYEGDTYAVQTFYVGDGCVATVFRNITSLFERFRDAVGNILEKHADEIKLIDEPVKSVEEDPVP